jgi:protein-L-isoaspartate O-methyltransferase
MDKEILDTWNNLAARSRTDVFDDLRAVLDPVDVKGVKNSYIDAYLKHYLLRYLRPGKGDVLLEVGCGPGRLTEYLSQFVRSVYGIDIIDTFIDDCGADPRKHNNTFYFHLA